MCKILRVLTHQKSFIDIYVPLTLLSKAYKLYALDGQGLVLSRTKILIISELL